MPRLQACGRAGARAACKGKKRPQNKKQRRTRLDSLASARLVASVFTSKARRVSIRTCVLKSSLLATYTSLYRCACFSHRALSRQYLYFCTSKARNGISICTFVLVASWLLPFSVPPEGLRARLVAYGLIIARLVASGLIGRLVA